MDLVGNDRRPIETGAYRHGSTDILRSNSSKVITRRQENARERGDAKGHVFACYSPGEGTLKLTGVYHNRFPFSFDLKPGSKTYGNLINYLLDELRSLPAENTKELSKDDNQYRDLLSGLACSLEGKLEEFNLSDELGQANPEVIEVFKSDFVRDPTKIRRDWRAYGRRSTPSSGHERAFKSVFKHRALRHRHFRLFDDGKRVGPQLISGFLNLEIEQIARTAKIGSVRGVAEPKKPAETLAVLQSSLKFCGMPKVSVRGSLAEVSVLFKVSPELLSCVDLLLHWGRYGSETGAEETWVDDEVSPEEISEVSAGTFRIRKQIRPGEKGKYGVTCFAEVQGTRERIWASGGLGCDGKFQITSTAIDADVGLLRLDAIEDIDARGKILQSLATFEQFVRTTVQLAKSPSVRSVGRLLFDLTKENLALRSLVSEYYQRIVLELEQGKTGIPKSRLKTAVSVLRNIGIGEVVFVAPEGPHAIAGGLAQVIVGLTKSLSQCGVACTVITPLYEDAQGNKHTSADKLLEEGVVVVGKRVPVKKLGDVSIPFGPTYRSGTSDVEENPRIVQAGVYLAENEGVRIVFLRHRRWASHLYASGWGDDQLRRAMFLSRGALEVMRDRKFGVSPHILVTNDWPSALVPVLLRTNSRYIDEPRFKGVETVHIMHNCGQGYQGRFPVNQFGEDLWPILGIGGEHFFGMTDPEERGLLNLTAGALLHSAKASVAVSKPYAEQLLTEKGGEGLDRIFGQNGNVLFGVSNGVDLIALRNLFWKLGETARDELGMVPLIRKRFTHKRLIKRLPDYKRATKLIVQRKYSLNEDPNAVLISFVGRLAEQKGIQLLAAEQNGSGLSVMEAILRRYPEVQLFIGGPPTSGDQSVEQLQEVLEDLIGRYPGRICGEFDFIPHRLALEITEASDLFLMPSRYEPGGITQLEALATGTLVVARNVGGIAATLVNYDSERDEGNSFLFDEYTPDALKRVICYALETIKDDAKKHVLITRAALAENDWSHRVPKYLSIMQYVVGVFDSRSYYAHLAPRWHLLNSIRAA